jgi:hypothetical protein
VKFFDSSMVNGNEDCDGGGGVRALAGWCCEILLHANVIFFSKWELLDVFQFMYVYAY